jgi:hypothetical protein
LAPGTRGGKRPFGGSMMSDVRRDVVSYSRQCGMGALGASTLPARSDIAIAGWCRSVWDPYTENRDTIIDLLSSTASFEQRAPAGGDLTVAWSCTF